MGDCPTCGAPMVWSYPWQRLWCSVYGRHLEPPRCAPFASLVRLVMAADDEARAAA